MSLRARLLVGMAVIAIVLGVTALVVTRTTEADLIEQVDAQLRSAERPVRGLLPGRGGPGSGPGPEAPAGSDDPPRFEGNGPQLSAYHLAYVTRTGRVVTVSTPDVFDETPPAPVIDGSRALAAADRHEPYTVGSTGGDVRYRVLSTPFRNGGAVVVALPLSDVDDTMNRLVGVELFAVLAVLAVLGLVTWWVMRLGVRPIKQMTATATAIAGGDLSHRVPAGTAGTEAGELGAALNQMLTSIEEAFAERTQSQDRLRRFVADASHELRTPVTTIRGYAELYRGGGLADSGELDEAMRRTEQEAVRMGQLVDDLLHLARLDQGRPLEHVPVDLSGVVVDAVRDARAVDPARPITATTNGSVQVLGDDGRLRQVVTNLVTNALVHTPSDTPVDVRVVAENGRAVLEVADLGQGMPTDVAARAFERFFRADPSRSRHRGGSGLGLAIVEATVRAHGGEVRLDSAPGRGTTVRVELPLHSV
jgi:two-component system, OmpR family, sensor kinase